MKLGLKHDTTHGSDPSFHTGTIAGTSVGKTILGLAARPAETQSPARE